jgi:hypothetical protein
MLPTLAEQSNKEGWPAERFLTTVMEHELAEQETRRAASSVHLRIMGLDQFI